MTDPIENDVPEFPPEPLDPDEDGQDVAPPPEEPDVESEADEQAQKEPSA